MGEVNPYFFLAVFAGVAFVFPLLPLALAWLWRHFFQPPKPGPDKNSTYECGIEAPEGTPVFFQVIQYHFLIAAERRNFIVRRYSIASLRSHTVKRRQKKPGA